MSIEEITNYIRISERIASSGQPGEHQFNDIANTGFRVVINLAMPNSDHAIPEEGSMVTSRGMNYIHIPVPFDAPNAGHLRQFLRIMSAFSDEMVWVHCVVNYRGSAFLYQYQRVVLGSSAEQARKLMLPSWQPNEIWQRFMALTPQEIAL
jgi:protein tyrosine phosphatase (PTP) superfamily phosphohydrolase (DUF442 family)